jgi:succinate dehydrogenase/fumarate reductase flavoprotein subunit
METFQADVAIVGAGGAGLRAAIAVAQADPSLTIALVSKVYPMRSHTVAAEGGAAAVTQVHDSLQAHFHDTVAGGDWHADRAHLVRRRQDRLPHAAHAVPYLVMLFAWHAVHRIYHSLHDVGIRTGTVAKLVCYGAAMAITLVAASSLLATGF